MSELARRRCLHHAEREAAARCPICGHCFCRECVTEHEERVICATCLRKLVEQDRRIRRRLTVVGWALGGMAGLMLSWLCFYGLGQALLRIPASFHEGTLWGMMGEEAS